MKGKKRKDLEEEYLKELQEGYRRGGDMFGSMAAVPSSVLGSYIGSKVTKNKFHGKLAGGLIGAGIGYGVTRKKMTKFLKPDKDNSKKESDGYLKAAIGELKKNNNVNSGLNFLPGATIGLMAAPKGKKFMGTVLGGTAGSILDNIRYKRRMKKRNEK